MINGIAGSDLQGIVVQVAAYLSNAAAMCGATIVAGAEAWRWVEMGVSLNEGILKRVFCWFCFPPETNPPQKKALHGSS